jgi:2'-5' RNA ligase
VRAFFAVELPGALRDEIAESVNDLAQEASHAVRWTERTSYHLTLKFLGDIAEDRVPELLRAAAGKLARSASFTAELGGFGAFPNARAAQIAWVGVAGGAGPLARLARQLNAAASRIGVERERRPYHAHITVGRLHEPQPLPIERFTRQLGGHFPVSEVVLFESRLASAGPTYVPCARLPLADESGEPREFDEFAQEI